VRVYGRTPFFYFVIHFFIVHVLATIIFFARGHTIQDALKAAQQLPFLFLIPGEGFNLQTVFLIWMVVVIIMYPLCKWYDRYKNTHREKWWLSYL